MKINSQKELVNTGDKTLDGLKVTIAGYYGVGYTIVLFNDGFPNGYHPAMVISDHCLKDF